QEPVVEEFQEAILEEQDPVSDFLEPEHVDVQEPVVEEFQEAIVEEQEPVSEFVEPEHVEVFEPVVEEVQEQQKSDSESEDRPKGWFGLSLGSFKNKIAKTSDALINSVVNIATGRKVIDDDVVDEIEEKLIKADIGLDTAVNITEKLRDNMQKVTPETLKDFLKSEFTDIINADKQDVNLNYIPGRLNIYLVTGVNGVGKTTLIGKLAYRFTEQGKKVLIGAGDTFRAAAEQQLDIWSKRANADIVRRDGADPASVVFDSIEKAKNENYDVLLIDTAGRLHNKFNLMQELGKIRKIIDKQGSEYLAESLLVLDATTGQNGLQQARIFQEAVQLTSVALTKLDGSAKGGIIIAIASELKLPVKLVGVGEKIDDLRDFDPDMFMEALFS
ncbi:MAG: signal recognition particle-docking protein FtsY, partial [Vampirovibrionia bacterium]